MNQWQSLAFTIAAVPIQTAQGPAVMVVGMCGAIRDDNQFTAGIILPLIYPEGYDWTKEGREKLDTYLNCECTSFSKCAWHFQQEPVWQKEGELVNKITIEMIPDGIRGILGPPRDQDKPRIIRPH